MVEIVSGYKIDNTTLTLGADNIIGINLANLNTWPTPQKFVVPPSNYLSIPITNNQNVATPAPFQQMIQLDLSQYSLNGVASDLSNVYFSSDEAGQNKLYSWRETPASLTSTQIWWVLLPNGIPANGTITIYLQVSSSTALDGVYTGEAPQLSSTYAQYDNGASVFQIYYNFAGTSLPTGWTATNFNVGGSTFVSINNGLNLSAYLPPSTVSAVSNIQINSTTLIDEYLTSETTFYYEGQAMCLVSSSSLSSFSFQPNSVGFQNGSNLEIENNNDSVASVVASTNINTPVIISVYDNNLYANYNKVAQISGQILANGYLSFYATAGGSGEYAIFTVQWLRTRALPPNGVMPSVILFSPNVTINANESTLTGTTSGNIVYSMPFQGTIYKTFIAYANSYENDTTTAQSISFPVAFTNTPYVVTSPSGLISSITTTGITLASGTTTTYTGWVIIEGY